MRVREVGHLAPESRNSPFPEIRPSPQVVLGGSVRIVAHLCKAGGPLLEGSDHVSGLRRSSNETLAANIPEGDSWAFAGAKGFSRQVRESREGLN